MPRKLIESKVIAGEPIRMGRYQIVTLIRSIRVHPFGFQGGLIWNRPIAVMILEQDGTERVVPIHDVTRQFQVLLLGVGLIGSLILWRTFGRRNSR
ncbi:MAG TPA: hypothetical protein G4O11_08265 [Anaerolineae bacterium]|nr:hypothetical protein [Anaerolineae bacterium]